MMHSENQKRNPKFRFPFSAVLLYLVLIAAGFVGCQSYVADAFGVEQTPRTLVATEKNGYQTNVPKVFAAGDMRRGQSLVVWGIHEGREAAYAVDEYLMGYSNMFIQ